MSKDEVIRAKVTAEEKEAFYLACESLGKNPSAQLRVLMRGWVGSQEPKAVAVADTQSEGRGFVKYAVSLPIGLLDNFSAVCEQEAFQKTTVIRQLITQWIDQQKEKKEPK